MTHRDRTWTIVVLSVVTLGAVSLLAQVGFGAPYGGVVVSVALIVLPQSLLALHANRADYEVPLLLALVIGALAVNYLFAFQFPALVGTDSPAHLSRLVALLEEHHYDLRGAGGPSFQFPLLYLLYGSLTSMTGAAAEGLTVWLAPSLNAAGVLFLYLFARLVTDRRTAYVAVILFSFDYFTFYFGFEFRTQSYALVLLLGLLYALLGDAKRRPSKRVAALILLMGLNMSHLVSAIQGVAVLLLLALSAAVMRFIRPSLGRQSFGAFSALAAVGLLGFMIFMAPTIDSALPYVVNRIAEVYAGSYALSTNFGGVAISGYMPIVVSIQWTMRALVVLSVTAMAIHSWIHPSLGRILVLAMTLYFGLLLVADTVAIGLLNPGRWGAYFSIGSSIALAWCVVQLARLPGTRMMRAMVALLLSAGLGLFAIGNVLKLPTWLIGTDRGPGYEFSFDVEVLTAVTTVNQRMTVHDSQVICGNEFALWALNASGSRSPTRHLVVGDSNCAYSIYGKRFQEVFDHSNEAAPILYASGDVHVLGPRHQ